APRTDAAERRETSCSPLRPPKRMPTRSFFMTLVWTRVSLASISRYDLSDLQKKKEYVMTVPFTMMNRREALATLGSGGLGLLAMHLSPVHTDSVKENALDTALLKFSEKSRQRKAVCWRQYRVSWPLARFFSAWGAVGPFQRLHAF